MGPIVFGETDAEKRILDQVIVRSKDQRIEDQLFFSELLHIVGRQVQKFSDSCDGPSKSDCKTAKKILKEADRLTQKEGLKLSKKRLQQIKEKISDESISSDDLPATLRRKFPGSLLGLTLREINDMCD